MVLTRLTPRTLSFILPLLLLISSLVITSCEEDDVEPTITLNADAGAAQTVEVGEEATLDGSTSTASVEDFSFHWSFASLPDNSSAVLQNANSENPSFTPDVEGDYIIELTINSGEKQDTDNVTVTALLVGPK